MTVRLTLDALSPASFLGLASQIHAAAVVVDVAMLRYYSDGWEKFDERTLVAIGDDDDSIRVSEAGCYIIKASSLCGFEVKKNGKQVLSSTYKTRGYASRFRATAMALMQLTPTDTLTVTALSSEPKYGTKVKISRLGSSMQLQTVRAAKKKQIVASVKTAVKKEDDAAAAMVLVVLLFLACKLFF